jgi:hypothetical protein
MVGSPERCVVMESGSFRPCSQVKVADPALPDETGNGEGTRESLSCYGL